MESCKHCDNTFEGQYCPQCGQKVFHDRDLNLKSLISEAFSLLTNVDAKIYKSLKLLFFYPGKLTSEYVNGIRVPYMKPLQLFLISNILFFIFLSDIDLFRSPSQWYFQENFDGLRVMDKVRDLQSSLDMTEVEVAAKYDAISSNLAKGLIFLILPFIGLVGLLLHLRKDVQYAKHIIFATHYFTFELFISVIISESIELIFNDYNKWMFIIPISLSTLVYYILGMRNFYDNSWILSILKGIFGFMLINMFIQFYRVLISWTSLNLI